MPKLPTLLQLEGFVFLELRGGRSPAVIAKRGPCLKNWLQTNEFAGLEGI